MSSNHSWPSTFEGVAFGLGVASGIRTLFKPDAAHFIRVAIVLWGASYFFAFSSRSFLADDHSVAAYYSLQVVVYIYRNLLLSLFAARLREGYGMRQSPTIPVVTLYSIFHIGWLIASLPNITASCLDGIWSGGCGMTTAHKAFRLGTEATFVMSIIILDSVFVYHLARKLCRQHGLQILTFHTNLYHAVLQILFGFIIAANFYRLSKLPSGQDPPIVYPVWQVQDVLVLLLLTEFGCQYSLIIQASHPDTVHEDLESAKVSLSRSEHTKRNLLQYLHHELRNNLQRILYYSDRLVESDQVGVDKVNMHTIQACSAYITSLVGDVLDIENFDNGTLALHICSYDLAELVQTEFEYLVRFADERSCSIELHNNIHDPFHVMGDPDRVRQILRILVETCINKLQNATDDGNMQTMQASATANENLTVELGSPMSDIFDISLIAPYTLHPGEGQHDLAQSVVHRVLRAVHGHIILDSQRQRARVVIPLERSSPGSGIEEISATTDNAGSPRRLAVLIVDDSSLNRAILRKYLNLILKDRVVISEAEDGQIATDMVLRDGQVFDLIWMDMVMPKKNGLVACEEIKSALPITVIIMVSANDLSGSSQMSGPCAPNDAILKPINKDTLANVLHRHNFM